MTTTAPLSFGAVDASFAPDLIVIGAGASGLPTALAAAEAGATVLMVEKTDRIGGTLHLSSAAMSGGGTKLQARKGIVDSWENHYADIVRISHGTANPVLAPLAARLAPQMLDWLDDHGFAWNPNSPAILYGHEPYSIARTVSGVEGGKTVLNLLARLLEPYFASGQARVLFNAPAERVITDNGRVVGVVAGGREWRASAVVVASGGFAANPELFARLSGGARLTSIAPLTSTGDALALTEPLGAALTGVGTVLPTIGCVEDPDRPGRWYQSHPDSWDVLVTAVPQIRPPAEIWVTTRGDRFLQEDEPSIDRRERVVLAQDRHGFFIVFDDAILDSTPPLVRAWTPAKVRELAAAGRFLHTAPTLAELAAKTGMNPAALEASVTAYNAALVSGQPDPVGKTYRPRPIGTGAYYAFFVQGGTLISWAGLKADENLAVLNANGQPIPGLYAVGEALGATSFMGNAFCGGMMVGPCLSLGRYLGSRLAAAVTAAR